MFSKLYDFGARPSDAELQAIEDAMHEINRGERVTNPEIEDVLTVRYPKADRKHISRAIYLSRHILDDCEAASLGFAKPTREQLKALAAAGKKIQLRDFRLFGGWTITELRPLDSSGTAWLIKGKRTRGYYDHYLIEKYIKPL